MTDVADSTLLHELDALPARVSTPFKVLMKVGGIDLGVLRAVLDAGAIVQRSDTLLGFTIALQTMERKNVPVIDTIRMAKEYGRRLNLQWSAKRWEDEHQRLSRYATLRQLSMDLCAYDVSDVEVHLPAKFKGYLIRTSRRLGMEGLRQRHCVAGYHRQLVEKQFAIAVVFVDRIRWTVQLTGYSVPKCLLSIQQAKSRLNKLPTRKQLELIHAELKIPLGVVEKTATVTRPRHLYLDNLRAVLPVLRELGARQVSVEFEGCGDSGEVGSVSATPGEIVLSGVVSIAHYRSDFQNNAWHSIEEIKQITLEEALQEITEDFLEEADTNYSDGDGGHGILDIDLVDGTVTLEISVHETVSETAFMKTIEIETGQELN